MFYLIQGDWLHIICHQKVRLQKPKTKQNRRAHLHRWPKKKRELTDPLNNKTKKTFLTRIRFLIGGSKTALRCCGLDLERGESGVIRRRGASSSVNWESVLLCCQILVRLWHTESSVGCCECVREWDLNYMRQSHFFYTWQYEMSPRIFSIPSTSVTTLQWYFVLRFSNSSRMGPRSASCNVFVSSPVFAHYTLKNVHGVPEITSTFSVFIHHCNNTFESFFCKQLYPDKSRYR